MATRSVRFFAAFQAIFFYLKFPGLLVLLSFVIIASCDEFFFVSTTPCRVVHPYEGQGCSDHYQYQQLSIIVLLLCQSTSIIVIIFFVIQYSVQQFLVFFLLEKHNLLTFVETFLHTFFFSFFDGIFRFYFGNQETCCSAESSITTKQTSSWCLF